MELNESGLDAIVGKKIGDIITEETKILTEFREGYEIKEQIFKKGNLFIETHSEFAVLSDFWNHIVICFKNDKPVCLFHVYDIEDVSLNGERGVVTATGHETAHEYWFDNGEYKERHTR